MKYLALMILAIAMTAPCHAADAPAKVTVVRCPDNGIQPQMARGADGRLHLVYLTGDERAADVNYRTSADGGKTWSAAIRVNSEPGAALMVGTVRGAQLALGKKDRAHVAWMGTDKAMPRGPGESTPMLYARMNDAGEGFEAQRNMIAAHPGLDGGGSVAADSAGNVYVAWHAPTPGKKGEMNRAVWVSMSKDEGKTFAAETAGASEATGACGCCAMKIYADPAGRLWTLYRGANEATRDIYIVNGKSDQITGAPMKAAEWVGKTCPMSTASFAAAGEKVLAAWEIGGNVFVADVSKAKNEPVAPPGRAGTRKHPTLAVGANGTILMAWDEGTAWKKGGVVKWQLLSSEMKVIEGAAGAQRDMPAWSMPAAAGTAEGFVVVY